MGLVIIFFRPLIKNSSSVGLSRVDQEIRNEPDMPSEKIAFKDVDDIDLDIIPF